MTRFLTILSIFSSTASFVGLLTAKTDPVLLRIWFVVSLALSLWVLFAPTSSIRRNVEQKVQSLASRKFKHPDGSAVIQQRGEKHLPRSGDFTIVFDTPMSDNPHFVFDKPRGEPTLEIISISGNSVEFKASSGAYPCEVHWVATGKPFTADETGSRA